MEIIINYILFFGIYINFIASSIESFKGNNDRACYYMTISIFALTIYYNL